VLKENIYKKVTIYYFYIKNNLFFLQNESLAMLKSFGISIF